MLIYATYTAIFPFIFYNRFSDKFPGFNSKSGKHKNSHTHPKISLKIINDSKKLTHLLRPPLAHHIYTYRSLKILFFILFISIL